MPENLYRPSELSSEARSKLTVGREDLIQDAIEHIEESCGRKSMHHFLFLGPRGIGKTHLLSCIEDQIAQSQKLADRVTVVRFPEESIGTLSFANFLERLVSALATQCPDEPEWQSLVKRLSDFSDQRDIIDLISPVFRRVVAKPKRIVLVLLENLQELFSKQIRSRPDVGAFRKFFMDNNGCQLLASALGHFDAITNVAEPFFDFFDVQILQPFTKLQSIELLEKMASFRDQNDLPMDQSYPRMLAFHDMVGGNPRFCVQLGDELLRRPEASTRELLQSLLDSATPVYQGLLNDVAAQERKVLEVLATSRGVSEQPTPATIARKLNVSGQQASTLLKRLSDSKQLNVQDHPTDKRSRLYSIRDGLLDVWLGWNGDANRRHRLTLVAEFLDRFYRKKHGPFHRDGTPRKSFKLAQDWPVANIPLADLANQPSYLADMERMRLSWVASRNHEFEIMVELLGDESETNGRALTRESFCLAKAKMLAFTPDENEVDIAKYCKRAILHFHRRQLDDALSEIEQALALEQKLDPDQEVLLQENACYLKKLRAYAEKAADQALGELEDNRALSERDYISDVYVSYAWGDKASEDGIQRETAVELLCTTLDTQGIRVGRDKGDIQAGDSIEEYAKRISRADRVIAVISKKSLESKYCMVFELFQAFRRCNFYRDEFSDKVIALVLDDAISILDNDQQVSQLISEWRQRSESLRKTLQHDDPDHLCSTDWAWLKTTEDMVDRLREMLSAIKDTVMPRGFEAIRADNFASVLNRLEVDSSAATAKSTIANAGANEYSRELANTVGEAIAEKFTIGFLELDSHKCRQAYLQASDWLATGGYWADRGVRAQIHLSMAEAEIHTEELQDSGLGGAREHLLFASELLQESTQESLVAKKLSIAAWLEEAMGECDDDFDALAECPHDTALRTRIELLLLQDAALEAAELADNRPLSNDWAESAALAYVKAERDDDAWNACKHLVKHDSSLHRYYRCLYRCASALFLRCFGERESIGPGTLTSGEKDTARLATEWLDPIIAKVRSAGQISTCLERHAVYLRLRLSNVLGDELGAAMGRLLSEHPPLDEGVIKAIKWGLLQPTSEIVAQLWKENQSNLNFLLSAVEIEVFGIRQYESGMVHAQELTSRVQSEPDKERLANVMLQIASFGDGVTRDSAVRQMKRLIGKDHRFFAMLDAKTALDKDDYGVAEQILLGAEENNDPDWLSMLAVALSGQGRDQEALPYLDELCEQTNDPRALRRTYEAMRRLGETDRVESTLLRLLAYPAEKELALESLSDFYFERDSDESLAKVIQILQQLIDMKPGEPRYWLHQAIAHEKLRQVDKALALLDDVRLRFPACEEAYRLSAEILMRAERPMEAFTLLDTTAVRDRFWSSRKFLLRYMEVGYRTGNDLQAHKAMLRIQELEKGVSEDDRFLRPATIDQMRDVAQGSRKFHEDLNRRVIQAQMPWAVPSATDETPLTAEVDYRTGQLINRGTVNWCAHFNTYATNGFVVGTADNQRQYVRSTAPKRDSAVVGDLTALITLYRLNLLREAARYFGRILIPTTYRDLVGRDSINLQPHQQSRVKQTEKLVGLLESWGTVRASELDDTQLSLVDTGSQKENVFCPGDVIDWLCEQGAVSPKRKESLFKEFHLRRSDQSGLDEQIWERKVVFTTLALRKIESCGLIEKLHSEIKIQLLESSVEQIRSEHFAHRNQAARLHENSAFWRLIHDIDEIQYAEVQTQMAEEESDFDTAFELSVSAMHLAIERELPLMSDDRVLLAARHHAASTRPEIAFGSYEVIETLHEDRLLEFDDALDKFRQLIRWRYRFYSFPSEFLLSAIKRYRTAKSMVGKPLQEIAEYAQSCLRDPGLLAGVANVDPPRSLAVELFMSWTRSAANLAFLVSQDEEFTDSEVSEITRWIVQNLVPSPPIGATADQQVNMADQVAKVFLVDVLARLGTVHDERRSAFLIPAIRDEFQLSDQDFHDTVWSIVKQYRTLDQEDEPVDPQQWKKGLAMLRRSVVRHSLAHIPKNDQIAVMPMEAALLEASGSLKKRFHEIGPSDQALAALADPDSDLRVPQIPSGPIFFHREPDERGVNVFPVRDLLVFPNLDCRKAAVQFFSSLDDDKSFRLANITKETLKARKRQAVGKTAKTWYPAMLDIQRVLDQDWMLNLAGLRQALLTKENSWIVRFWESCVCPNIHPAISTPKEAFFAVNEPDWVGQQISEIKTINEVDKLIDEYLLRFRHLPLDDPHSLASVLEDKLSTKADWSTAIKHLLQHASQTNYLKAFQACRALVAIAPRLSSEEKQQTATCLASFIATSQSDSMETPAQRNWKLLRALASHFARWISFYGQQLSADNTAALAWWLADHLCEVILKDAERKEDPDSYLQQIYDRNIHNVVQDTELISQYYTQLIDGSFFRINTIDITAGGPFLLSLLTSEPEKLPGFFSEFDEQSLTDVLSWYISHGVLGIGGHSISGSLVFQNTDSRMQQAIEVISNDVPEQYQSLIAESGDDLANLADSEWLVDQLREFPDRSQGGKVLLLQRLNLAARQQTLPADALARFLWNQDNRKKLLDSLDDGGLATLLQILSQSQSYADRDYGQELPFLLLSFLYNDASEQRQRYLGRIVVGAASTNQSYSAVDELIKLSQDMPGLKAQLELEHEFLNYIKRIAPRWVWSRVRPLLPKFPKPTGTRN